MRKNFNLSQKSNHITRFLRVIIYKININFINSFIGVNIYSLKPTKYTNIYKVLRVIMV